MQTSKSLYINYSCSEHFRGFVKAEPIYDLKLFIVNVSFISPRRSSDFRRRHRNLHWAVVGTLLVPDSIQPRPGCCAFVFKCGNSLPTFQRQRNIIPSINQALFPEFIHREAIFFSCGRSSYDLPGQVNFNLESLFSIICQCIDLFLRENNWKHSIFERILIFKIESSLLRFLYLLNICKELTLKKMSANDVAIITLYTYEILASIIFIFQQTD